MLLHLGHSANCLPLNSINKHTKSFVFCINLGAKQVLFGFKKSRRNYGSPINAVEKNSEFEIDPDKAREALRKLDDQLQSLSNKQLTPRPPKIPAMDLDRSSFREKEEPSEISGSFLTSVAFVLLGFTIFYNILFLTVIKPSIDGPERVQSADIVRKEAQQGASQQQLSTSGEFPVGP